MSKSARELRTVSWILPLAAIALLAARSDEEQGATPVHGPGREPPSCETCHETIHAEWAASLHGQAWTDPIYQRALRRTPRAQRESCHACHIPEPLLVTGFGMDERGRPRLPRTRSEHLDLGVHCTTCHADAEGAMHGPRGTPTEAHASVRDETFLRGRSDALCLSCHSTKIGPVLPLGQDFLDLKKTEAERSCVSCHMAEVERPMATTADGRPTPARSGRSHALLGVRDPEFLAKALEPSVRRLPDGRLELRLTNTGAGHRTPGLLERRWDVTALVVDEKGERVPRSDRLREEITAEEALFPGDSATWILQAGSAETVRVHLKVQLEGPGREREPTLAIDTFLEPR